MQSTRRHWIATATTLLLTVGGLASNAASASLAHMSAGDDWPQWRGPNRDGVWRETGLRETLPEGQLEIRWRMPVASGYSGPTVAGDAVFVTDRVTGPEAGEDAEDGSAERVWCFDRHTGKVRWSFRYPCSYRDVSYDAGPRCSVIVHDGRAYTLGSAGHLFCFDADTGDVIFRHDLAKEYTIDMPIWGIAATPVIEDDLLIVPVSGKDACLVAFDTQTGEERWRALPDRGNYSSPIVVDHAGHRVLICMTGDRIVGVDAATGALHWEHPFKPRNMPLGVASPVYHEGGLVFFTAFYDGCVLLHLVPDELRVEERWRLRGQNELNTSGLHSIISTPLILDDHIYGVDSYGELRCLQLEDGQRVWEDLTAVPKSRWSTIHFVQNGERTWMFNERGELLIGTLTPAGFEEIARTQLIQPTTDQLNRRGGVCWSHPAFAHGHVFARNGDEIVCADLRATEDRPPK